MIGITSTAKGKGLNKSPKTALSPTFQPPHLPSPCRANTKPPSPIGTSRSSHLSPETNTKTQNQLIYRNLKEYRCKPQNSPVWLVQGAAIYINIAAPCTTEIHTENQHFTLRVKPRVQPRFLHRLLILCFSCNPVIPKNKKSPKHFPFSVKIPIFASVPRAERSNAAKPAQLPNRYRLPNFLLFKSYLPTDYKKTIVFFKKIFMMKRRKWLISLVVLGVIMGFSVPKPKAGINGDVSLDSLAVRDTVALPPLSYSMKVGKDTLILPDSSKEWNNFFNELDSLRAGKDTAITIVQLGDSHIQAGHLSGRVMRLFQQAFGNAGRGWIAPFKLSKTNEPDDYFIKSVAKDWIAGRCIQHVRKTPIGIGGIGIKSVSPSINFDVVITPNNGAGYEFNEAILYRGEKSMPMLPAGALKDSVQTFRADTVCVPGVLADTFRISCLTDTLQLQSTRRKEGTNTLRPASSFTNLYYGLTLKNGSRGILYHSIGVNGAMYVNYTDEAYIRQLALLKPSLLIISMGTNETFGRRFNTDEFSGQIEAFLALVKKELPNTAILLTTPPECYRRVRSGKQRTYVRNDNTERAARAIRNVAKKEEVACWDLFTTTGGKNSCRKWHSSRLMGRDRIHFTKEGYQEQGTLLFRAFMESYNNR